MNETESKNTKKSFQLNEIIDKYKRKYQLLNEIHTIRLIFIACRWKNHRSKGAWQRSCFLSKQRDANAL